MESVYSLSTREMEVNIIEKIFRRKERGDLNKTTWRDEGKILHIAILTDVK